MSSKDKYGKFKKKDFVRIIYNVRDYLGEVFGYEKKPFLFETKLIDGCLMCFDHHQNTYAIFYDYKQFKDTFCNESFKMQTVYVATILAHEMRHYYQHRQMIAKKPIESEETIELWRENERNPKFIGMDVAPSDIYLQPLELDAYLFEYVFGAEEFGLLLSHIIADEQHFNALEKLYVEYFGESDEDLFNDKIRAIIKE